MGRRDGLQEGRTPISEAQADEGSSSLCESVCLVQSLEAMATPSREPCPSQ